MLLFEAQIKALYESLQRSSSDWKVRQVERLDYGKTPTCVYRNRKPCNSSLTVNMASGMDCRRVCPTSTTTTATWLDMAAILQLILSRAALIYSIPWLKMLDI